MCAKNLAIKEGRERKKRPEQKFRVQNGSKWQESKWHEREKEGRLIWGVSNSVGTLLSHFFLPAHHNLPRLWEHFNLYFPPHTAQLALMARTKVGLLPILTLLIVTNVVVAVLLSKPLVNPLEVITFTKNIDDLFLTPCS